MNKQDLVNKIAKDVGVSKANASAAVESLFEGITKSLKKGQPITFVGFGTFKTSQRKARTARNPQTGEPHRDSEAARRAIHRRQGPQDRGALTASRSLSHAPALISRQPVQRSASPCRLGVAPLSPAALTTRRSGCYTGRSRKA